MHFKDMKSCNRLKPARAFVVHVQMSNVLCFGCFCCWWCFGWCERKMFPLEAVARMKPIKFINQWNNNVTLVLLFVYNRNIRPSFTSRQQEKCETTVKFHAEFLLNVCVWMRAVHPTKSVSLFIFHLRCAAVVIYTYESCTRCLFHLLRLSLSPLPKVCSVHKWHTFWR